MITHKGTRELITDRLRLRRFFISDADRMFKNYAADALLYGILRMNFYSHSKYHVRMILP